MKLAVSNIAWYPGEIDDFITLLSSLRCEGIELAANMIWDEPVDVSITKRKELRAKIEDAGLKVTGLQSLLYTHPEFVLFNGKHLLHFLFVSNPFQIYELILHDQEQILQKLQMS